MAIYGKSESPKYLVQQSLFKDEAFADAHPQAIANATPEDNVDEAPVDIAVVVLKDMPDAAPEAIDDAALKI